MPSLSPFCPSRAELHVEQLAVAGELITITAVGHRPAVPCPACGVMATRVHSQYQRGLADLPWQGARVQLVVTVRRFFCDAAGCERRIFAERLPQTAARYARRTGRAATVLELPVCRRYGAGRVGRGAGHRRSIRAGGRRTRCGRQEAGTQRREAVGHQRALCEEQVEVVLQIRAPEERQPDRDLDHLL